MSVFESSFSGYEHLYILEKHRISSFMKSWPFDDSTTCNIKKMAEAGFYWCGNERENDTTSCFACGKVLDGWEATDDPWTEHIKHAPQCAFVKLRKPESQLTVQEFLNLFETIMKNAQYKMRAEAISKLEAKIAKRREKFVKLF